MQAILYKQGVGIFFLLLTLGGYSQKTKYLIRSIDSQSTAPVPYTRITDEKGKILGEANAAGFAEIISKQKTIYLNRVGYDLAEVKLSLERPKIAVPLFPQELFFEPLVMIVSFDSTLSGNHQIAETAFTSVDYEISYKKQQEKKEYLGYFAQYSEGLDLFSKQISQGVLQAVQNTVKTDPDGFRNKIRTDKDSIFAEANTYFTINTNGELEVDSAHILHGLVTQDQLKNIYKQSSKWIPAFQNGKPIKTHYTHKVRFLCTLQEPIYPITEKMPEFKGGDAAMFTYLSENISYPKTAEKDGISGVVFVTFVVEKDGSLSDIRVHKGIHPDIDAEALRVVKSMQGKWNPGYQYGLPVRVQYNLPLRFSLNRR